MLRAVATSAAQIRRARTAAADGGPRRARGRGRGPAPSSCRAWAGPASPATCSPRSPAPLPGAGRRASRLRLPGLGRRRRPRRGGLLLGPHARRPSRRPTRRSGAAPGCSASVPPTRRSPAAAAGAGAVRPGRVPSWRPVPRSGRSPRPSLVAAPPGSGSSTSGPTTRHSRRAAARLEAVAESCRPDRDAFVNPAKTLALELGRDAADGVGRRRRSGPVAAYRLACQVAENAKLPAVCGALPEAHHNQVVALDGALAAGAPAEDIFRDRRRGRASTPLRLRLVLLHDDDGSPARPRAAVRGVRARWPERARGPGDRAAVGRYVGRSSGSPPSSGWSTTRSVYLALLQGIDPTPVAPIDEVKSRLT